MLHIIQNEKGEEQYEVITLRNTSKLAYSSEDNGCITKKILCYSLISSLGRNSEGLSNTILNVNDVKLRTKK